MKKDPLRGPNYPTWVNDASGRPCRPGRHAQGNRPGTPSKRRRSVAQLPYRISTVRPQAQASTPSGKPQATSLKPQASGHRRQPANFPALRAFLPPRLHPPGAQPPGKSPARPPAEEGKPSNGNTPKSRSTVYRQPTPGILGMGAVGMGGRGRSEAHRSIPGNCRDGEHGIERRGDRGAQAGTLAPIRWSSSTPWASRGDRRWSVTSRSS